MHDSHRYDIFVPVNKIFCNPLIECLNFIHTKYSWVKSQKKEIVVSDCCTATPS